jgi:hypothetical protein
LHSEAVQAADAEAEEPAADVARAELQIDMGLHPQRNAVLAARHDDTGVTAENPAPVEQLEVGASNPDGASGATWPRLSGDEYDAAAAATQLVAASPWWLLNASNETETQMVTLRSLLSEVTAARLEPQLWRLQVNMCDPKQSAVCMPACIRVSEGRPYVQR